MTARNSHHLTVISLFSGVGGLDIGLEVAGLKVQLGVEIDEDARRTLEHNHPKWKLASPGDIHLLAPKEVLQQAGMKSGQLTLLAGGPPCQPFSKSGFWVHGEVQRLSDPRAKTLRAYLGIIEAALPEVVLLENVRGLAYEGKDEALQFLRNEIKKINKRKRTKYELQVLHIDSADYGVPQFRERVFLIAHRAGKEFVLPPPTHGPIEKGFATRFSTAWDAIGDLDEKGHDSEFALSGRWAALIPSIPEGKNYLWHTPGQGGEPIFGWRTRYWSFLLKLAKASPSWTIQAEPGPATGPFHWKNRHLSVRELCRLQTFPDWFEIVGNRRIAQRQIGNAVPCAIGELLGLEIRRQFLGERPRRDLSLLPAHKRTCPPPEQVDAVPRTYRSLYGDHKAHPGTGLGPRAKRRTAKSRVTLSP